MPGTEQAFIKYLSRNQYILDPRHPSSHCTSEMLHFYKLKTRSSTSKNFLYCSGLEPNPEHLQGVPVLGLNHHLELVLRPCSVWLKGLSWVETGLSRHLGFTQLGMENFQSHCYKSLRVKLQEFLAKNVISYLKFINIQAE